MIAFAIHIVILVNTLLSVIDNCVIGGLSTIISYQSRHSLLDPFLPYLQPFGYVPVL
jgi:hypothetical protein